jgi:preprotein translocase subunit SecB
MSEQQEQQEQQPVFSIDKIYVKDLSLEVPNAPEVFLEQSQPEIDMQLASEVKQIGEGYYDCALTVTVTAKVQDKVLFLVEAAQAGIFQIRNVPAEDLDPVLGVACPNILFPYARETVSNLVSRAGFPPVMLSPINFEALYMQQRAQAATGNA